jgi:hypothetical protein
VTNCSVSDEASWSLGYVDETKLQVGQLGELVELAVLVAISLVLVSRVIFRPTDAFVSRKRSGSAVREATARDVLGPSPTRASAQIYRKLLRDARHDRVVIDWERARREQKTMRPQPTLVSAARRQLGHRSDFERSSPLQY